MTQYTLLIIEEKSQFTGQPCDRCDRKKHKTLGIYARAKSIASLQKIKRHALSTHFENLSWQYQLHPKKKVQFSGDFSLFAPLSTPICVEGIS